MAETLPVECPSAEKESGHVLSDELWNRTKAIFVKHLRDSGQ